jgi:hypothetical protein
MLEGGLQAAQANENVVGLSHVRDLERRVRELERLLGRKTMEVEILKEALDVARVKNRRCNCRHGTVARTVRNEGRGRYARGRALQPALMQ